MLLDGYTFEMYEADLERERRQRDREEWEANEADRIIEDRWIEEQIRKGKL